MGIAAARDRMPPIPAAKMTGAQKNTTEIIAGPREQVVGPFFLQLRSPEFISRPQKTDEYLSYNKLNRSRAKNGFVG